MAPSNLEATVMILDVGPSVSTKEPHEELSFFEKARNCIIRIIERKIFSRPNDLIGLVIMGTEESVNNLVVDDSSCRNISVSVELKNPTWDYIELLQKKVKSSEYSADWVGGLKVAADFLKNDLDNKKVSKKKIVLMTDLKTCPDINENSLDSLIDMYKSEELELIVIGPEIWEDEDSEPHLSANSKDKHLQESELVLKRLISDLSGITCTFEEAIFQLLFHKKKATNPMAWNVDLTIGTEIAIPVSGFGKIRDDKTIGKWNKCYRDGSNAEVRESISTKRSYFLIENNTTRVDDLDIVCGYLYGQSRVPFTKIDKKMEYESGPRCLSIFGFTKRSNISWDNLSGDGTTYIVARKGNENARIALDAFITALHSMELVAIARKVYNKNNAPNMNVLFPIIESDHKCLSMINLAFKEDYRYMTFPSLNKKKFQPSEEQIKAIDGLIDSMDLSEVDECGKEILSLENCVNPYIQNFFDTIAHRALYPNEPLIVPRTEVLDLMEIPKALTKLIKEPLEEVKKHFELVAHEKVKTGKYWVNQNLKEENKANAEEEEEESKASSVPKVSSVMTDRTVQVGTVTPVKDFKEVLENGVPFNMAYEQMTEVIERIVFGTIGSNYAKPLSALRALRDACTAENPSIFNTWSRQMKSVLLERGKEGFFGLLRDEALGLITKSESPVSSIDDNAAADFYNVDSSVVNENVNDIDMSEIDDLFS